MKTFDLGPVTAYAIAVKNGYQGSEAEWIASLKGLGLPVPSVEHAGKVPVVKPDGTEYELKETGKQPDWNQNDPEKLDYVKNRTHYEGTGLVELLAEITLDEAYDEEFDAPAGYWGLTERMGLVAGKTYVVRWNGEEYSCTAQDLSALYPGAVALGDCSIYNIDGLTGNGEPFQINEYPDGSTNTDGYSVTFSPLGAASSGSQLTISILQEKTVLVTLPSKFLHPSVPWVDMAEFLPETTLTTENDGNILPVKLGLVAGNAYTVFWNDTEYQCIGQAITAEDASAVVLGDVYTMSGGNLGTSSTGEPFIIIEYPESYAIEMEAEGLIAVVPLDDATSFTVSVSGEKVNKLDNRCLDLAWLPVIGDVAGDDLFAKQTVTLSYMNSATALHMLSNADALTFVEGQKYLVTWDDKEYICVATYFESGEYIGFGDGYVNLPFIIMSNTEVTQDNSPMTLICTPPREEESFEVTLRIQNVGIGPNKLPPEFLPDTAVKNGAAEIILSSSTTDSTKKFKLTVDDTGTLTATEVTE